MEVIKGLKRDKIGLMFLRKFEVFKRSSITKFEVEGVWRFDKREETIRKFYREAKLRCLKS